MKGYVLATTDSKVKWYKFDFGRSKEGEFELMDTLDLDVIARFGDKETAKLAAQSIGLKTWRYVKL